MNAESIESLIARAKGGDAAAFRALYEELSERLFRYVRSRTQSRDDALDVLQETFVDFWKSLGTFEYSTPAGVYSFLYTVASRKISKLYRWRKPTVGLDAVAEFLSDPFDPEAGSEALLLWKHVGKLKDEDREVIELRYYAGLTFGEIGELIGQSEGAVKVRHHRTIGKLKSQMGYGQ